MEELKAVNNQPEHSGGRAQRARESVAAILEELEPHIMKMMASDLQAAVNICLAEGGSWRTRHLQIMPNRDSPKETGCRGICQVDICWQT